MGGTAYAGAGGVLSFLPRGGTQPDSSRAPSGTAGDAPGVGNHRPHHAPLAFGAQVRLSAHALLATLPLSGMALFHPAQTTGEKQVTVTNHQRTNN